MPDAPDTTALLNQIQAGREGASDALFPRVYDELHGLAHQQLQRRRPGQTLNTTALVHEAYLKLVDAEQTSWESRTHFFAVSAKAMRQIIIDYARRKSAQKRGGERHRVTFDERLMAPQERAATLIALDRALDALTERDERMGRVVELRFFGGMTEEEVAEVVGVSARTVRRDWRKARAWLAEALIDPAETTDETDGETSESGNTAGNADGVTNGQAPAPPAE